MKKKKITIILAYDYGDEPIRSNASIAEKIKKQLSLKLNSGNEIIESIKVEDQL